MNIDATNMMQLAVVFASVFAAWKLDSISRTLGEVTTQIKCLQEDFKELKESFNLISNRVDKAEEDLKEIIKQHEEDKDGKG